MAMVLTFKRKLVKNVLSELADSTWQNRNHLHIVYITSILSID